MDLKEKTRKIIKERGLFKKHEKIVLGVSGGVDSAVLLDILSKLKDYKLEIIVAHLNHGLRKTAEKDEKFVKELAINYGFKFRSKKVKLTGNLEEAGREARYNFFREVLVEERATSIVTAHTADDNAETILLNLIRGTGLRGLSGMDLSRDKVKRPLLSSSKKEILDYAKENKLKWREDITNKDIRFSRNRVRRKILPEMEKINPKTSQNILRSASILKEVENFLEQEVESTFRNAVRVEKEKVIVELKKLEKLPEILRKRIIHKGLAALTPQNISSVHLENLLIELKKGGTKQISLPLGFTAEKIYDKLIIGFEEKKEPVFKKKALKNGANWGKWQFSLNEKASNRALLLDKEKASKLYIRAKKKGDFLFLQKNKQKKKVSDLFIDAKVPRKFRENYPIIVTEQDEVVAVPLVRVSGNFAATKKTKETLTINVLKNEK